MADLSALLDAATRDPVPDILGIVVLAMDREGNEFLAQTSGITKLDPSAKSIENTSVFRLASCTKLITAIAILRLLSLPPYDPKDIQSLLDDPNLLITHLPELTALPIITSPVNQPIMLTYQPRTKPLTLRHLLTHTSGIGYDMIDPRLRTWRKERGQRTMTLHGPLPDAVATPLLFEPGEGWMYGGSTDWVGVLVERMSGVKFGTWLREHIFDVVECDSGIGFSRAEVERAGDVVMVVTKGKDGRLKEHKVKEQEPGIERGGGGLFASAQNFGKVLGDVISTSPKLLSPAMADILFTPQLLSESKSLPALQGSAKHFRSMSGPLTPDDDVGGINHALGGMLVTEDNELGQTKRTMTWGGAFNCMWFANRQKGVAGFYGSAMWPPGDKKSSELMGAFLREVWGKL